ncbi:hypothetical protein COBT_003582 [Conglomerata obtusa]
MIDQDAINKKLAETAKKIVENGKGILAADESESSIQSRFEKYGIENTEENRRIFRQMFMTSTKPQDKIGGVIMHEETFVQKADSGKFFVDILIENGISPGIKLDKGLIDYKMSEKVSVGLEDLEKRLNRNIYRKAEFAKWRSIFSITETTPSESCIHENCSVLAQYALICQRYSIVPIVEPEILWDGKHTIEEAETIAKTVLSCLFYHLNLNEVFIPGILLKPAFVTPGKDSIQKTTAKEVAKFTYNSLASTIPVNVPGVVFLSGGHEREDALLYLDQINKIKDLHNWKLTFSYGRALTDSVLAKWEGKNKNVEDAISVFLKNVNDVHRAALGKYL